MEASEADVSSLIDTWLLLKAIEVGGERNRARYVLKSRGMEHSVLTNDGLRLLDVYLGPVANYPLEPLIPFTNLGETA